MDDQDDRADTPPAANSSPTRKKRKRRRGPDPAFVAGTSTEFLGKKPLPRAVRLRPLVFLLGPRGAGKSRVARRLLGEDALHLDELPLLELIAQKVRERSWPLHIDQIPLLILETPCFLIRRPGVSAALRGLLELRIRAQRKTIVIEALDGISVQQVLMNVAPPDQRATIMLRFPVGRGRQRFAVRVCDELGIPRRHARAVRDIHPWNYDNVYNTLRAAHTHTNLTQEE